MVSLQKVQKAITSADIGDFHATVDITSHRLMQTGQLGAVNKTPRFRAVTDRDQFKIAWV